MVLKRTCGSRRMPCDWHIHFVQICRALRKAPLYHFVKLCKALRILLLKGDENVVPSFDLVCINVYDVNIVLNHGVELKVNAPPWIYCFMFRQLKSMSMVYVLSGNDMFETSCKMKINKKTPQLAMRHNVKMMGA